MTITIDTEPTDDSGCLMHAEDATAQLCLAIMRLGHELHSRGLAPSSILRLRVLALGGADAVDLLEVVVDWLGGGPAEIACLEVERLHLEGMLAAVSADVASA